MQLVEFSWLGSGPQAAAALAHTRPTVTLGPTGDATGVSAASPSSSRSMAQTLSSSPLSSSPLWSSPLSDTMKLSAGEVGASVAMLPQRCWRAAAGSVWVRVVSALASRALGVALLGVRPQQLGTALLNKAAALLAPGQSELGPALPGVSPRSVASRGGRLPSQSTTSLY